MRQTTKKKYHGRSAVGGILRTALTELKEAIDLADQPQVSPLASSLRKVIDSLEEAADFGGRVYTIPRSVQSALSREIVNLTALLNKVVNIPVTQEEKLAARAKRARTKRGR